MKRSEKKLAHKANFSTFLALSWYNQNGIKDLKVTKIVKEIKFEGIWGELEAKTVSRENHS